LKEGCEKITISTQSSAKCNACNYSDFVNMAAAALLCNSNSVIL